MKKILAIVLTFVMVISLVPLGAVTVSATTSGTTGDCTWTLDGTILTISGNGEMGDYDDYDGSRPWGTGITKVIIENGVKRIGDYAFGYGHSLISITIPDSVTSIGEYAFLYCDDLTIVYITDIAKWCGIDFENAHSNPLYYAGNPYLNNKFVTDLSIPDSVESISDFAFISCDNLTNVTFGKRVESIGKSAFEWCDNLTSVTIPDSVISIGDYAFWSCKNLISVNFGKSIESIGDFAFDGCYNLTSVMIPNSVVKIGDYAFRRCYDLTSVTIPDSVKSIGHGAFWSCEKLSSVYYRGTQEEKKNIIIGSANEDLMEASWWYNSCIQTAEHTYLNDCDTICNNCDWTREASAHKFINATCKAPKICAICGEIQGTVVAHDYKTFTTNATYAKAGSAVVKCTVCNNVKSIKVIPKLALKKTKISKLTAARKSLKVKIKREKSVSGYQIQYSLKKNFKSAKTVTLKKNSLTSKTIKKLKSKKTYYVRVRTYKTYKGKKYYSAWSSAKSKKTK